MFLFLKKLEEQMDIIRDKINFYSNPILAKALLLGIGSTTGIITVTTKSISLTNNNVLLGL